jgi:predicted permease
VSQSLKSDGNLSWREAWYIAGQMAREIQFRSAMSMSQGATTKSIERVIDRARNQSRYNKFSVSIFIGLLAVIFGIIIWGTLSGEFGTPVEHRWITAAFTISLFSFFALAFLITWGIMISTSYISTNAAALGHYVPVTRSDTGKLALLAYIRLFDVQMFTIIISFPLAYGIATMSLTGALACLGVFLINVGIAITAMLALALYFHTRLQSSGGSRFSSIIRMVFTLLWAVAFMSFTLISQLLYIIIPLVESAAIALTGYWGILYFAYPFTLGTFVVLATGVPGTPLLLLDFAVTLFYGILAIVGVRWASRFLQNIGIGAVTQAGPSRVRPASIKVGRTSLALLRKDLRIAMRTPGQAVMFFLPIITMLPIFLQFIWDASVIRVSDVLVSIVFPSIMLGFFSIFFLSVEARGMAFTLTLPLKTAQILRSKAQLITCMSIAVPLFVVAISFFRTLTHPVSYAIAFSQIAVVYVSALLSLVIFIRFVGGGRLIGFDVGRHITQMLIVGLLSAIVSFIPLAFLGGIWITVATITGSLDLAHWSGLGGLWIGILFNYLLGKLFIKYLLID